MQVSIFGACFKPGFIGKDAAGKASGIKMGDEGDGPLISPDGVAPNRIVGMSSSDISVLMRVCCLCGCVI